MSHSQGGGSSAGTLSRSSKDTAVPSTERGLVWIVDDSPLEAEMARRAISPTHDVTVFTDGAMMLERLASEPAPDALVLDWQLPGMSGIEVCRFLRATRSEIELPVLMLTVHGQKQDIVDGLAAGANDYVTKPYDASELRARVGTLVRTRRLHERAKRAEKALEVERDRLLQSESRFRFLAKASIALSSSLDSRTASASMALLAVPAIADWCGIYLVEETPSSRHGVQPRPHPEGRAQIVALAVSAPLLDDSPPSVARVIETGCAHMIPSVAEALARSSGQDLPLLTALSEAGVSSWMAVPLARQGRAFGCLAFALKGDDRRFQEVDHSLAEELGRRTAVAIDNARLFEMTQRERKRVEEANATKDEFLATVSHELRTPLSAILGWVVMLGGNALSEEKRARAIATIERNARSQAKLIEDLLDVSRIISGKLRLNVSPTQLATVLEAALETIRPAAEAKDVHLASELDPGVGSILGDPERLQQIVWNLLSNAVKFTPRGGRVHVRLRRSGSDVEITVADTGQGISASFLPFVFDRFRQADMGKSRTHGGLGLGLAITRHLVELHGGSIEAASPGENLGTTMTVRIPSAQADSTAAPPREEISQEPAAGPSARPLVCPPELEGLRVLVVEDQPDTRDLLVDVLDRCGARVTAAANAADGLEALERDLPDVLVSDVGMPGETGYDLIRRVRSLPPERGGRIPAIAVTAYARSEDRNAALSMGFDMHVSKPIEPSEILTAIAALASRTPAPRDAHRR